MNPLPELKHYRRRRESWLLPNSRVVWVLQLFSAVFIGWAFALLVFSLS